MSEWEIIINPNKDGCPYIDLDDEPPTCHHSKRKVDDDCHAKNCPLRVEKKMIDYDGIFGFNLKQNDVVYIKKKVEE